MKNKRLTYLLFPIVAIIWGYALYKYLFETQDNTPAPPMSVPKVAQEAPTRSLAKDTFSLLGEYRDPFLSRITETPRPVPASEMPMTPPDPRPAPKPVPVQPTMDWGIYKYNGLIQRTGTDQLVGILRIKGKAFFVNVGTAIQEVEANRARAG